jgi:endonuclease YncB( thermonuclease family)
MGNFCGSNEKIKQSSPEPVTLAERPAVPAKEERYRQLSPEPTNVGVTPKAPVPKRTRSRSAPKTPKEQVDAEIAEYTCGGDVAKELGPVNLKWLSTNAMTGINASAKYLDGVGSIVSKVVSVYDGDTFTVIIPSDPSSYATSRFYLRPVRMFGYDSPEMKVAVKDPMRAKKKQAGLDAKAYAEALVLNKFVLIRPCAKPDKYGRLLAHMYVIGDFSDLQLFIRSGCHIEHLLCVSKEMLDAGHGYPYAGGKKEDVFEEI